MVVYVGMIGTGFLGYVIVRIALDEYSHPIHWASGLIGAVAGFFVGGLWYRWRGDVI